MTGVKKGKMYGGGVGSGIGAGVGTGMGVGAGVGVGVGLGTGIGIGLGTGLGIGPGLGTGLGPGLGNTSLCSTITLAVSKALLSCTDMAVTVRDRAGSFMATLNKPPEEIVVPWLWLPSTSHITSWLTLVGRVVAGVSCPQLFSKLRTKALNCKLPP